mgnify:FL=1
MNLVTQNQSITMSSREIAELVNQRHDNVKRTIETLGTKGVISHPQIEDGQKSANGVVEKIYQLGKRDSLIVVAQLCPEFTAKIVDRWQELEAQQTIDPMKILNDPAAMRGLLLGYTEKVLSLELTVATQAPKVEAFDRIAEADGCLGLQEAGKALQQKPNKFIGWLREKGWIYRRAGSKNNLGHAEKVNSGYVKHTVKTIDLPDGAQKVCEQAMITPKGLAKLAMMLNVNQSRSIDLFGGAA